MRLVLALASLLTAGASLLPTSAEAQGAQRCWLCVEIAHETYQCEATSYPNPDGYSSCETSPSGGYCIASGYCGPTLATTENVFADGTWSPPDSWVRLSKNLRLGASAALMLDLEASATCNGIIYRRNYAPVRVAEIRAASEAIQL